MASQTAKDIVAELTFRFPDIEPIAGYMAIAIDRAIEQQKTGDFRWIMEETRAVIEEAFESCLEKIEDPGTFAEFAELVYRKARSK